MWEELKEFIIREDKEDFNYYELLWFFAKYDVEFSEVKEYLSKFYIRILGTMPGSRAVLSNFKSKIELYQMGFSLSDISDDYGVPKSTLNTILGYYLGGLRDNHNEFANSSKSLSAKSEGYWNKVWKESDKYKSLSHILRLLLINTHVIPANTYIYTSNRSSVHDSLNSKDYKKSYYTLRCSYCNQKVTRDYYAWKKILSNSIARCSELSCCSFCNHVEFLGNNTYLGTKRMWYFHSEDFRRILNEDFNSNLSLSELSEKYRVPWKFIIYHLVPYFGMGHDDWIERGKRIWIDRVNSGEYYNPFKDPEWQSEYGSKVEYISQYGINGFYHSDRFNKDIHYRSTWERDAYSELDRNKDVLSYDGESLVIPYEYEGVTRNYLPDIVVITKSQKYIIEIKPSDQTSDPINLSKWRGAEEYCKKNNFEFIVITELNWERLCTLGEKL